MIEPDMQELVNTLALVFMTFSSVVILLLVAILITLMGKK